MQTQEQPELPPLAPEKLRMAGMDATQAADWRTAQLARKRAEIERFAHQRIQARLDEQKARTPPPVTPWYLRMGAWPLFVVGMVIGALGASCVWVLRWSLVLSDAIAHVQP